MSAASAKAALRADIRRRIALLDPAARADMDARLAERLRGLLGPADSPLLAYAALADEVNFDAFLRAWLQDGRTLALPRVEREPHVMQACQVNSLDEDFERGPFGIREPRTSCAPLEPENIACILVPGRAFSADGGRLGRGGGYYDRYLPRTRARRIGIAYETQMVKTLPLTEHDARLDCIVTPDRVIVCRA